MAKKNYITPKGLKVLMDEYHQLFRVERPEVTKLVQWAASNGDRSENADYLYGKRRLREIDRRVRFLDQRIEAAVVVDPTQVVADKIQFGATVILVDENDQKKRYCIVGTDEINLSKGHISWMSPIGQALLGKSQGEVVLIQTPQGEVEFEVFSIAYLALD
jgi:transcription elongation factor GreB